MSTSVFSYRMSCNCPAIRSRLGRKSSVAVYAFDQYDSGC